MKLEDVKKGTSTTETQQVSARITKDRYDFVKQNGVSLRLLIETAIDELREQPAPASSSKGKKK